MSTPAINCPYCGNRMIAGTAYVRGTFVGFLLAGASYQHLWFKTDAEKNVIIESGKSRPGHHCTHCGAVTIATTDATNVPIEKS